MIEAYLDSTNLRPEATKEDIEKLCQQAAAYNMAAVCINPCFLNTAKSIINGTGVKLCTVVGFPLGAELTSTKVFGAKQALIQGAQEIDMVINLGALKEGNYNYVLNEIKSIMNLKEDYNFLLKVIVETALLNNNEIGAITQIVSESSAEYIKTSTGFSSRGVSLEDINIIKNHKDKQLKIKASGGIKELSFATDLIKAGVKRLGTSSATILVEEFKIRGGLLGIGDSP